MNLKKNKVIIDKFENGTKLSLKFEMVKLSENFVSVVVQYYYLDIWIVES
jgi:hypothetical protein